MIYDCLIWLQSGNVLWGHQKTNTKTKYLTCRAFRKGEKWWEKTQTKSSSFISCHSSSIPFHSNPNRCRQWQRHRQRWFTRRWGVASSDYQQVDMSANICNLPSRPVRLPPSLFLAATVVLCFGACSPLFYFGLKSQLKFHFLLKCILNSKIELCKLVY